MALARSSRKIEKSSFARASDHEICAFERCLAISSTNSVGSFVALSYDSRASLTLAACTSSRPSVDSNPSSNSPMRGSVSLW